ncbi:MAG TPA: outer membrane protein assembly factor BamD [Deltaproteobacteria bacterium]|nr:outer membrane protein assembly factor BamD [Deltaproteobacteria bacterium]
MSVIFYSMIFSMRYKRIILILFILVSISGCAHKPEEIKPAEVLFQEATQLATKKKVDKATEIFMEVRTYYPGHDLARKSLISIADLNFDEAYYDVAMESYKEYRLLYPTDLDASYSLYKIGLCYFNQMNSHDRDQTNTALTIQTFEEFIRIYPDSPYVSEAEQKRTEARSSMAKHYLYIGKFYLKNKNNAAACKRFDYVKHHYPDIDLGEDIDALIVKSCKDTTEAHQAPENHE